MPKSSGGARMRPEELKAYLNAMHSDQAKPTTKSQVNGAQCAQTNTTISSLAVESKSNDWKEKGNAQFKSGNYSAAIDCYTLSIEAEPTCVAQSNRAMAHLKLHNYDNAVKDCTAALALDENYVKAWLRRGAAHRELGFLDKAIADFEAALRLEPRNKSAMEDRKNCIEKWIQENTLKGISSSALVSEMVSIPIVLARDDNSRRSEDEVLKQVSTTRGDTYQQVKQQQKMEGLIKEAVVQEIEDLDDNKPPPLPEAKVTITTKTQKIKELPDCTPSLSSVPLPPLPQQQPALFIAQAASFKAPKTGVDFERSWRGFKGNVEQQAVYLRQINAHQLPVLLKQVLTPSLLVALQLTVLGPMLSTIKITTREENEKAAAAILKALPKVVRFSMNVLSLSASQKKELRAAWDTACLDFPELGQIRTSYLVE
ncbi:putative RNA polymerase II-associated protein 3 [Nannochloris sp. 'desiccata']|nr:putative RNA polymerase II-associated protein 3 [Chlorella desiccata (nom. nud.)]